MNPWLSIVVPSYNQARFVEKTLQSLLDQNDRGLEIIVVDGGSTDGSVDIIRRYAPRLAYWVTEKDHGQSHALNKGFAKARGEWLGWLNSDDLLLPGTLARLRDEVQRQPATDWWIGGGYFINDAGIRFRSYKPPVGLARPEQLSDWQKFWLAQPSTFFRRSLFDAVGGTIREDLHYAMDIELWLRFLKTSAPGFIDQEFSVYRHHVDGKTHAMSENGETEIVRVLVEHIGLDAALNRVRVLAAERNALQSSHQRIQAKLRVLFALNAFRRSLLKFLGFSR